MQQAHSLWVVGLNHPKLNMIFIALTYKLDMIDFKLFEILDTTNIDFLFAFFKAQLNI